MEFLCLLSIIISALALVFVTFRDFFVYLWLWIAYFSCFQVGQTFLWFQWDTLLLEAGFLTLFVAPCRLLRSHSTPTLPHDRISLFLIRWLLFRLMFASGVVKLQSECPTWWDLTALHWHFESQCIPTWLAYYAHQLPDWLKHLSVASTFVIEILIPPMFLLPIYSVRCFAFATQVFLMLIIAATGNYNFFNFITAVLALSLLVDSCDTFGTHSLRSFIGRKPYSLLKSIFVGAALGALVYWAIRLFGVRIDPEHFRVSSEIRFSKDEFYRALSWSVLALIRCGCVAFALEIGAALVRCFTDVKSRFCVRQIYTFVQCVFVAAAACTVFAASLVPISWLDSSAHDALPDRVKSIHTMSDRLQMTHSYGLFRRMTGVGGRPEILVEGAYSVDGPWFAYEFKYKPGDVRRAPSFMAPHQARLDWQMWFAALDSYQRNPWLLSFVHKLLLGQKEVLRLIERTPFPDDRPPKLIRIRRYLYHYTAVAGNDSRYSSTDYWWRELQDEYLPPVNVDALGDYLQRTKLIVSKPKKSRAPIAVVLQPMRRYAEMFDDHQFVWAVALTCACITCMYSTYECVTAVSKLSYGLSSFTEGLGYFHRCNVRMKEHQLCERCCPFLC